MVSRKNNRWLYVVLISALQLLVLLVAITIGAGWVEEKFIGIAERQAQRESETQLATLQEQLLLTWSDSSASMDERRIALAATLAPDVATGNDWARVIDVQSGKTLWNSEVSKPFWKSDSNNVLSPPEFSDSQKTIVVDELKKDSEENAYTNNESEFLLTRKTVNDPPIELLMGREKNQFTAPVENTCTNLRRAGFGCTLILGLVTMCLTLSLLQRYDDTQTGYSDRLEKEVAIRTSDLTKTKNAIIFGLARLAESRDTDTGEHLDRISRYVTILANHLRDSHDVIDDKFINDIALASSLHDIGKVGIPDAILLKPGLLTSDERFIMEQHTLIGGDCLEAIESQLNEDEFLVMAREIAYSHHERWDGKGYPYRKEATDIPVAARITAVADVYDALTTTRPYKKAMSHEQSREIILSGRGTQFDPDVVDAFVACEDDFQAVAANQTECQVPALLSLTGMTDASNSSMATS